MKAQLTLSEKNLAKSAGALAGVPGVNFLLNAAAYALDTEEKRARLVDAINHVLNIPLLPESVEASLIGAALEGLYEVAKHVGGGK